MSNRKHRGQLELLTVNAACALLAASGVRSTVGATRAARWDRHGRWDWAGIRCAGSSTLARLARPPPGGMARSVRRRALFTITTYAAKQPDRPAVIFGNGEFVESYGQLEERSRRIAHAFRRCGLVPGDCVAALVANDDVFYDLFWACHRVGLYFTPVNWHLQRDEVQYVVDNCDAKLFIAHARFAELAQAVAREVPRLVVSASVGGAIPGFRALEDEIASAPSDESLGEELEGSVMLYSSGTTGRPKGVRRPLVHAPAGDPKATLMQVGLALLFGMKDGDVYLSPAPLYHAAPLAFSSAQHRIGATVVAMRHFDAEEALRIIEGQKVTTSQWVPTHFKRLLSLPEGGAQALRRLLAARRGARGRALPDRSEAGDDRMVGRRDPGVLRGHRRWRHADSRAGVARHTRARSVATGPAARSTSSTRKAGRSKSRTARAPIYFEAPPDPTARFNYYKDDRKTADDLSRRPLHDRRHRLPRSPRAISTSPIASRT